MIRKALPEDMPVILKIYEQARRFMAEHGNPRQWGNSSPAQNVLEEDIRKNFDKLMSSQSRIAAKAAGRAVDVSADDFDDAD